MGAADKENASTLRSDVNSHTLITKLKPFYAVIVRTTSDYLNIHTGRISLNVKIFKIIIMSKVPK